MFEDRLVSTEDRQWFQQLLRGRLSDEFKSSPDDILGEGILLYGDFMAPNADVKVYDEITDYEKVCVCVCVYIIIILQLLFYRDYAHPNFMLHSNL